MSAPTDSATPTPAPAEYVHQDDPFGLAACGFSGARELRRMSRNSWVKDKDGHYVLSLVHGGPIYVRSVKQGTALIIYVGPECNLSLV